MATFDEVRAAEIEEVGKSRTKRQPDLAADAPVVGLAFSGGGIRSATINLGILQGLAKHGLLKRIDYLSTVSVADLLADGWCDGSTKVELGMWNSGCVIPRVNLLRSLFFATIAIT